MLDRVDMRANPDLNARLDALKSAWDGNDFRCYYTGWKLALENHADPLYATWEHRTPRDETDIVVCAAIINDMKTDLDDAEFRNLVIALAKRFNGCTDEIEIPDLKHYRRNHMPEPDRGITKR